MNACAHSEDEAWTRRDNVLDWLSDVGLVVVRDVRPDVDPIFDGVWIMGGVLFVAQDAWSVESCGDVLHEAGHLAVVVPSVRSSFDVDADTIRSALTTYVDDCVRRDDYAAVTRAIQCGESEAMAWQYAAATHLGMSALHRLGSYAHFESDEVVEMLCAALAVGSHPGVHGLQAAGMTTVREYPRMQTWVQTS